MISTNRSDWFFERKGTIFIDKVSKSGKLIIIPKKGELPDNAELEDQDVWQGLVARGRSLARLSLVNTIVDADFRIPSELARYLNAALMHDSVAANLIQPYLQLVRGSTNDSGVLLSPAQILAESDFFYLYLGSLERRNQAHARDIADSIYRPLVWLVVYFYEDYVLSAKPAAALSAHARLNTQLQEIHKQNIETLSACRSAPQPDRPLSDPLALSYYAFYVLGDDTAPPAADATLSAPTPTTSTMLGYLSKVLRVTAAAPAPPPEVTVPVATASSGAEASGSAPVKTASLSLKRGLKSLWGISKWKNTDREVEGDGESSRAKRARKVTGES